MPLTPVSLTVCVDSEVLRFSAGLVPFSASAPDRTVPNHCHEHCSCWLYVKCSYQVRAKDLKRLCGEENCGWLNKTGLTSTRFQKRWCAIHELQLFYFDNPRSEEPNGVVSTFRPSHAHAHTYTDTHACAKHMHTDMHIRTHLHTDRIHTHCESVALRDEIENTDVAKCGKLYSVNNFMLNVTVN
jgi:hypothetical protein